MTVGAARIGGDVRLAEPCTLYGGAVLEGPIDAGPGLTVFPGAMLGGAAQHRRQGPGSVVIGRDCVIRECATVHRGSVVGTGVTRLGDRVLVMAYAHIGHDSVIGNHCILVNNTALAGHVHVDDWAILSGFTLVHQYCHIGAHSFSGMGTAIGKDVPAFVTVFGNPAEARSMNFEGMRRRGFSDDAIHALRRAYKTVYRQGLTVEQAIVELAEPAAQFPEVALFLESIQNSTRGITR